jgi:hypothetical protein
LLPNYHQTYGRSTQKEKKKKELLLCVAASFALSKGTEITLSLNTGPTRTSLMMNRTVHTTIEVTTEKLAPQPLTTPKKWSIVHGLYGN